MIDSYRLTVSTCYPDLVYEQLRIGSYRIEFGFLSTCIACLPSHRFVVISITCCVCSWRCCACSRCKKIALPTRELYGTGIIGQLQGTSCFGEQQGVCIDTYRAYVMYNRLTLPLLSITAGDAEKLCLQDSKMRKIRQRS